MPKPASALQSRRIDDLHIADQAAFRAVGLFRELRAVLRHDDYQFRLMPSAAVRWDMALVLNLGFWQPRGGGDVLMDAQLEGDVVCHMAWHHLAGMALAEGELPLAGEALLLGEAIASAFDVYLLGRLVPSAPDCDFVATQLPAMADSAEAAGRSPDEFAAVVESMQAQPEQAFEQLRQLLYDTAMGLWRAADADQALQVLLHADAHRFGCILHHYELANWLQQARAAPVNGSAGKAADVDAQMRRQPVALEWLADQWLAGYRQRPVG